jgi:hypothetical protein
VKCGRVPRKLKIAKHRWSDISFTYEKNDELIADDEGSEYASRESALEAASADAREIIANQILAGQLVPPWSLEVTASDGSLIATISFRDFALSLVGAK